MLDDGADDVLGVDHADDVLRLPAPYRHAGMAGIEHFLQHVLRRHGGVDRYHVLAVDHDVGDGELAQVEHARDHVAVLALHRAFLVMQVDGAADLVMRLDIFLRMFADAEQAQHPPHQELHRIDHRRQDADHEAHRGGDCQRETVGARDGERLGQHLDEEQDQHGHQRGRDIDRARPETGFEHAGRQRRRQDVHEGVAQQQRPYHALAVDHQRVDVPAPRASLLARAGACARATRRSAPSRSPRRRRPAPAKGRWARKREETPYP
ncbi:MAG: hypothetical protein WDN03_14590 [Rhizomicrobium sp.]